MLKKFQRLNVSNKCTPNFRSFNIQFNVSARPFPFVQLLINGDSRQEWIFGIKWAVG